MTIPADYEILIDSGNGTTRDFAVTFPFDEKADLVVTLFDITANADVSPPPALNGIEDNDYTVLGTQDPGTGVYPYGTVRFNVAPGAAYKVVRARNTPEHQNVLLVDNARFPAKTVEGGLDRLELQIQEIDNIARRAVVAPASDGPINMVLPPKDVRAGFALGFDPVTGMPIVSDMPLADIEAGAALANVLAAGAAAVAQIYLQVAAYRQPADAVGDDGPALQRALNAAAPLGYRVFVPLTGLRIATAVDLPNNSWLEGSGAGCVITGAVQNYLQVSAGAARITLKNFAHQPTHNSFYPKFVNVTDLFIENVTTRAFIDGTTGLMAFGVRCNGCDNVWIDKCYFLNCNDAVYLAAVNDDGSGKKCGNVMVTRCFFEHTLHGNFFSYPAQIYQYQCDRLVVANCVFKNIFPGNETNPGPMGYCVYEGDGLCQVTRVINCTSQTTEAAWLTCVVQTASGDTNVVQSVNFLAVAAGGGFLCRLNGAARAIIAGCVAEGGDIIIAEGQSMGVVSIAGNVLTRSGFFGQAAIRVGNYAGAKSVAAASVIGNTIRGSKAGGIFINQAAWFEVQSNSIFDVNTNNYAYSGGSNDYQCVGLAGFGAYFGVFSDNTVLNTKAGGGHAQFAVSVGIPDHAVRISNTRCDAMEQGAIVNGFNPSQLPSYAGFGRGERLANSAPVAGAVAGWVVIDSRKTTLWFAGGTSDLTIYATSTAGMATGDKVSIALDNGSNHNTTITSVPAGDRLTIATGLAGAAAVGNFVRTMRLKAEAALAS